jgi:hypothetical protein
MITARYTPGSRLGNQMMQYASLYSLSRYLDYRLSIPPIDDFINTSMRPAIGRVFKTPEDMYRLKARHFINYEKIDPCLQRTIVNHECCYLENIYNFDHLRKELLQLFAFKQTKLNDYCFFVRRASELKTTKIDRISPRDVVVSLRIGDFVSAKKPTDRWRRCVYTRFLGFDYFDIILSLMRFDRLFITSDEPLHPLLGAFGKYDPILVRNDTPAKTMAFVTRFDRIAISESTYSWWAAYLSNASEVYYPISKRGLWGVNTRWNCAKSMWRKVNSINARDRDLYLRVDHERYKYVHQESGVIYKYYDAPGKRPREDFTKTK